MKTYLLDTGFFYALLNSKDKHHRAVKAATLTLQGQILLPSVVLTEVAYLIQREMGQVALAQFIEQISGGAFVIETPTLADFTRAAAIVRQYADAKIDFVDAVIVAIAERLDITTVLTIDIRHFRLFRPQHCDAFEILP